MGETSWTPVGANVPGTSAATPSLTAVFVVVLWLVSPAFARFDQGLVTVLVVVVKLDKHVSFVHVGVDEVHHARGAGCPSGDHRTADPSGVWRCNKLVGDTGVKVVSTLLRAASFLAPVPALPAALARATPVALPATQIAVGPAVLSHVLDPITLGVVAHREGGVLVLVPIRGMSGLKATLVGIVVQPSDAVAACGDGTLLRALFTVEVEVRPSAPGARVLLLPWADILFVEIPVVVIILLAIIAGLV